ncbi:hypothetical protein HMPREF1002_04771 [Porphyromonas sp. 31_2]|nr:hypothetical protein HMPREF1002_04771 [Porphyromonas sp. 31_2]
MENVSLQFQRGIIMEKQNWKFYWKWSVFVLMTMLCLLSFYKSYQNVKYELQEESQTLFQQAVQDDTNRRIKDLGDAFCFPIQALIDWNEIALQSRLPIRLYI